MAILIPSVVPCRADTFLTLLIDAVTAHLKGRFPTKRGFPREVTASVFQWIGSNPHTSDLHRAASAGPDGSMSDAARRKVNRRIGRTVAVVLGAAVVGRAYLGFGHLIKSHALLVPR